MNMQIRYFSYPTASEVYHVLELMWYQGLYARIDGSWDIVTFVSTSLNFSPKIVSLLKVL